MEVAQYDVDTQEINFALPLDYTHQKDRETFHYEDRCTSIVATANHNVLTKYTNRGVRKHKFIDTNFSRANQFINAGYLDTKPIVSDELTRFLAMYNADGSMSPKGYVTFTFSKKRKIDRCKEILDSLGISYSVRGYSRNGKREAVYYIGNKLNDFILKYSSRDKTLNMQSVFDLNLHTFLEECMHWDGTQYGSNSFRLVTTNKTTAEIYQIMGALSGHKMKVCVDAHNHVNSNGLHAVAYYVNLQKSNKVYTAMNEVGVDFTKPIIQDVYCVTMPLGTVVIRHNGKVSIQGNCDLSQAELRVASIFSGDENMINAYNSGSDLHTETMNFIYRGKTPKNDEEAKAWRTNAKATNFGFLYGMQASTFIDYAKGYGLELTIEEAEEFRDNFFTNYPELLTMHDKFVEYARKHGYTYSPIGRKRFLPDIKSTNWKKASASERQAINTPVQGFASDLVISALADIIKDKTMDKTKYKILGTIHDAVLFEVEEDLAEEYAQKVKEHLENPSVLDICEVEMTVPIVADIEIGSAWGLHD